MERISLIVLLTPLKHIKLDKNRVEIVSHFSLCKQDPYFCLTVNASTVYVLLNLLLFICLTIWHKELVPAVKTVLYPSN